MKSCYKISQTYQDYDHVNGQSISLILNFADDVALGSLQEVTYLSTEDPVKALLRIYNLGVSFYFTFDPRAFGIESKQHFGQPVRLKSLLGVDNLLTLQPKKTEYLKDKTKCVEQSFWQLVEEVFASKIEEKCKTPCSALGTPNPSMPICKAKEDWTCALQVFSDAINEVNKDFTSSCTNQDYTFEIDHNKFLKELPPLLADRNIEKSIMMTYKFQTPETMIYHEEYYIYGFVDFLGSVGGTFGLCIGISFYSIIVMILSKVKSLLFQK